MNNKFIHELYNLYSSKKMKNFFEFAKGEKRVLVELQISNIDISPSDLCHKLGVSKQRITSILNSLNKKKYIIINIDEKDRRKTNIKLTQIGKDYIDKLTNNLVYELNCTLSKIQEEDVDKLTDIIANINKILNE